MQKMHVIQKRCDTKDTKEKRETRSVLNTVGSQILVDSLGGKLVDEELCDGKGNLLAEDGQEASVQSRYPLCPSMGPRICIPII
jgi:hypothetical protein